MEEEEAILKKQLDEAKDFESRREVRQKLRELRKKKINALDSDVGNSAQRSRRQETKTVEETVTDNNTSPSEKESEKSVNNCGNGDVNEEKRGIDITEELDRKEEENGKCESEPLAEVLNGDSGQNKGEEDQEEKSEIPAVDEPTLPTKPPRPADGKITEEYVEQLQDVEDLEELLKEVPLSEFNLRKKIRITIRERKKQKELAKFGMGKKVNVITGERSMSNGRHRYNEKEKDSRETQQQELMPNIEGFTEGTILSKLDSDFVEEDNGKLFDDLKKSASKTSTDDNTDTASSLSTQSTVSEPETSKPRQDQISAQDSKEGETYRRQQKEISHKTQTSVAKSSTPTDFRANLKKTGVNLRNLDKKGKVEKFDFRSQLKKTGLSTSYETSGLRRRDSPKVDFRSALQQTTGQRYGSNYLDVNVTADIHTSSKGKQYLEEIKKSVSSKSEADQNKDEEKNEDKEEKKERKRRVSSADLLGLVNQPREDVTADLALRVGRKTETLKSPTTQTFNLQKQLVNKEADEDFQAQMARRKHKVNTPQLKPSDITEKKSRGGKAETSDFRKVLRKASVTSHTSQVFKKQDRGDATTDISSIAPALVVKKGSYSEQSTIPCDTVDTGKSQSGNAIAGYENSSGDSVVGGKETENVSGHFPSKISQDIGRAKEANPTKTDGKKSFGKSNIDAMFEKRRRERVMAKKKEAAEKKQGRAAFKAKLEAQNPKPANSGGRSFQTGSKITRAMIEWCRRKTDGYEGVDIQNFTTSWTNGLAMCALLHRFVPEKIDYGSLNPKDRRGNWKLAFDVAGECGVEPLLELEDVMACSVPEPKSLMTYVHFIYQFFCEAPKEKRPPPGFDDDEDEDDDD